MNRSFLLLLFSLSALAQQAILAPVSPSGALFIAPDTAGGIYATVFDGREPAIIHINATGQRHTMVTEKDVHHHEDGPGDSHDDAAITGDEFGLVHSPAELWLSGDRTRLFFPVYRHIHPWHLADIMQLEGGKITSLFETDQKLRYALAGQTFDRYMINSLKATLSSGRLLVYGLLSTANSTQLGNQQTGQLSPVLFSQPLPAPANQDITAYMDLDLEDHQFSSLDPGCMSQSGPLFAIGVAPVTFFQKPSFTLLHTDAQGRRQTLASAVRLDSNAFACTGQQASVIYRDENGRTRFLSVASGLPPSSFFDGQTIGPYPLGEITEHLLSPEGLHYFLMKAPNGAEGVFTIDPQGRASTVLEPGFAGPGRLVRSIVSSGSRLYALTTTAFPSATGADAQLLALYHPSLPEQTVSAISGGSLQLTCLDCPTAPSSMEVEIAGRKFPASIDQDKVSTANLNLSPGRYPALLRIQGFELPFVLEIVQAVQPVFTSAGIVNSASFSNPLSPGVWATIFGQGLAPDTFTAQSTPLPSQLGGIQVWVDFSPAPLALVSPTQINFQLPWELGAPAEVNIQVVQGTISSAPAKVRIDPLSPAIFRAGENFVITTPDFRLVGPDNPCRPGGACIIWANGLGRTNPAVASGKPSPPGAEALEQPLLFVNNVPARILFAGLSPGLVGVFQINFLMPGQPGSTNILSTADARLVQGGNEITFRFQAAP